MGCICGKASPSIKDRAEGEVSAQQRVADASRGKTYVDEGGWVEEAVLEMADGQRKGKKLVLQLGDGVDRARACGGNEYNDERWGGEFIDGRRVEED
nr:hypothetical protein Itr_chr12CG09030 [Ipomoea trifida]